MADEWDCYEPSEDDWATLDPGAFEFLDNIKSQSSISTKSLAEFLHRLKKPAGTAQQSKSKLATSIASALLIHPHWSQASLAMIRVAQMGGDRMDLLAALFAVDFHLDANASVRRLMFWPVPWDLAPPAPPAQRESLVPFDTTQPSLALADPMVTVLAFLQEQK